MTPGWILDTFAALMVAVAAVSAARLAVARPWRRGPADTGIDVSHLLMAVAMAGMLAPGLDFLPAAGWEAVFGLMTAWFAWRTWLGARADGVRSLAGHCAPHLVHSGAMLYMYLALTGGSGSMMRTLAYPTVAFAFTLALLGYSARDLDQLPGMWRVLAGAGLPPVLARPAAMAATVPAATVPAATVPAGPGPAAALSGQPAAAEPGVAGAPPATASGPRARALLLAPGMMSGCRTVMGLTMALMLVIMI